MRICRCACGLHRGQNPAASVPSGKDTVIVRDRSSSHSPHHATGGQECGGLARRCKTTLWSVIRYLTQLPNRALSISCLRGGQRHRAAGRDVMLCRTLLHSSHTRTARFNPSITASRFDERLLKVMYFQPFSSGLVEYLKSGYRPLERVPGKRTTPSSTKTYRSLLSVISPTCVAAITNPAPASLLPTIIGLTICKSWQILLRAVLT